MTGIREAKIPANPSVIPLFTLGSLAPQAFHPVLPAYFAFDADEMPRWPDRLFRPRPSIYEGSQNRKNCRYSITAAVAVTRFVSAIPLEKITKVLCFGVRGSAQQRFNVKDFL